MMSRGNTRTTSGIICSFLFCITLQAQIFTSSHLPIFVIDTDGETIPDEPKIMAQLGIIDNGPGNTNHINDPFNAYDGHIGIEVRGSSSQMFPKKQYAFETREADGSNLNVSLLGMPVENDWILYAPYSDKALIRNVLTYTLTREMGWYATRTRHCELVLNGDYRGLYVLMEKIKRDDNRVDISRLDPDEISGDDLTGGYILKIDKWDGDNNDGWYSESPLQGYSGVWYQFHYPAPDNIAWEQRQYIQDFIADFETLMAADDYTDPSTGYQSVMNMESVIDYALIQEFTGNVDGYRLSDFFYKDRDSIDPRLTMGPQWDFNIALGNCDYYGGGLMTGWRYIFDQPFDGFQIPFWWVRIWEDPAFQLAFNQRYQALRESLLSETELVVLMDSLENDIGAAAARNFERWPILDEYVWPNAFIGFTWEAELGYLESWITGRLEWLDSMTSLQPGYIPLSFHLSAPYPNPFNPETRLDYALDSATKLTIRVFDVMGRQQCTLVHGWQPTGRHHVSWNGRDASGRILPAGTYFIRLEARDQVQVQKVILLK